MTNNLEVQRKVSIFAGQKDQYCHHALSHGRQDDDDISEEERGRVRH